MPGVYYVLIRGHSEPAANTPVTILAELLPLSITDVQTDQGGDSKYVTTTISGAQFQPNAIVKLVSPGLRRVRAAADQLRQQHRDHRRVRPHRRPARPLRRPGHQPDGQMAIAPYRFQVEQTIQPDVTIGVGGPRFILAGDSGTYSVALQNLGNINAPYVEFNVGIPQLSERTPRPGDRSSRRQST